jgi:tRNA-dihydrouridine synthase B
VNARLAALLNRPLRVGRERVAKRLFLAPMSKLGHPAFRELVAGYGGHGLLFTEMCSARSVARGHRPNQAGFMWRPGELAHLVCQLFGNDPDIMARAAQRVEAEGFFGVDINFGCSVAVICRQQCGAALLRSPDLVARIVAAIRKAVSIPLFVKFRTGWQDDPDGAVELARRFEAAGADALTYHPRVAPDRRSRPPRWEYIARVKKAVDIPVVGNGNVFDARDCENMLATTGCDGVMLGRLAIVRPWTFACWTENFAPPEDIYQRCALELAANLARRFDPPTALRRFHKFITYYAANFRFGHSLYAQISKASSLEDAVESLKRFCSGGPDVLESLNISLLR